MGAVPLSSGYVASGFPTGPVAPAQSLYEPKSSYLINPLKVLVIERQSDQDEPSTSESNLDDVESLINSDDDDDDDDPALVGVGDTDANLKQLALDQDSSGLYISTSEFNYAIVSPELALNGWLSVSVNGDEVFIVSLNKKFQAGSLKQLDPLKRELLSKLVAKFVSNLQGLQLNDGLNSDGSYYSQSGPGLGNTGDFIASSNGNAFGQSQDNYKNDKNNNYAWCSRNYYQNTANSALNDTLDGDVYFFDSYGNQLNIYSSSVNSFCRDNLSIVFRDENYFAYSRAQLNYNWNRFFVSGTNVFIIYQDGTVLAKPTWALDSSEFNAILRGRTEVKQLVASQLEQAQANGKTLADPKTADIVKVVKSVLLSSAGGAKSAALATDLLNLDALNSN